MAWKSVGEISGLIKTLPSPDRLLTAFSLHEFVLNAVFSADYTAPAAYADAIALTAYGETVLGLDATIGAEFARSDVRLAALGALYHHDLIVDHVKTDLAAVRSLLDSDLTTQRLRWPHRFGRLLYDKFADMPLGRPDHISREETATLLSGTPQGVYQVGHLSSGPLGFLDAEEPRYLPPRLRLPLWHCADTGCVALHEVVLVPPQAPAVQAYRRLNTALSLALGPSSRWDLVLARLHRKAGWSTGRPNYDLPAFIAEAIIGDELKELVSAALKTSSGDRLRGVLGARNRAARGSAEEIAGGLTDVEQLQLLTTLPDKTLVALIDELVRVRRIVVPLNEFRSANMSPPTTSNVDMRTEMSTFGVRSRRRTPIMTMATMLWDAYERHGLMEDLKWRLRSRVGVPARTALIDYLRASAPADAIRELVLPSLPVTRTLQDALDLAIAPGEDSATTVSHLLWKLGFAPPRYDESLSRMAARLGQFNEILLRTGTIRTEDDREGIRGVGVNVFVSAEELIEQLIIYNVWLLSSDHFAETRFTFDRSTALARVSVLLGPQLSIGEQRLSWDHRGGNSLGTLLAYLNRSLEWMKSLIGGVPAPERPESQLPHFAVWPEVIFPFRHTQAWADCDKNELLSFITGFESIVGQLNRGSLAEIRNGLDHKRDDANFPSIERMLACVARLREALELADVQLYLPKPFWLHSQNTDRFGRTQYLLHDYKERPLSLFGPSSVPGMPPIDFDDAMLIAPGNLLGHANSELRFRVAERSPFSRYWSNYPRRPAGAPPSDDAPEGSNELQE